jgi:hypothetical protein
MYKIKLLGSLAVACLIIIVHGSAIALDCPKAPEQIKKNWEVEVNAAIAKIGPVKGGELITKTRNATQDLLGKLPDAGRVYLEQMMYSAYCSGLRDDKTMKDSEKAKLLREYNREVRKAIASFSSPRSKGKKKATKSKDNIESALKQPTFSEKVENVNFSLGERGISAGYRVSDLEKSPKEPFMFNNFSPVKVYVKNGKPYADVKIYAGSGFPAIEIKSNQLLNKPPEWDFNSNENALEIVDKNYRPIYQFFYKGPSHIVFNGIFPFPGGLILANENGAIVNPYLPATFTLKRIFKYPSWKYPGKVYESGDR